MKNECFEVSPIYSADERQAKMTAMLARMRETECQADVAEADVVAYLRNFLKHQFEFKKNEIQKAADALEKRINEIDIEGTKKAYDEADLLYQRMRGDLGFEVSVNYDDAQRREKISDMKKKINKSNKFSMMTQWVKRFFSREI